MSWFELFFMIYPIACMGLFAVAVVVDHVERWSARRALPIVPVARIHRELDRPIPNSALD